MVEYENDMGNGRALALRKKGSDYVIVEMDGKSSQIVGSSPDLMEALQKYMDYFKVHCDFSHDWYSVEDET